MRETLPAFFGFAIIHLGELAAITLLSGAVGTTLLRGFDFPSAGGRAFLRVTVGLGTIGSVAFLLGVLHRLDRISLAVALLALSAPAVPRLWRELKAWLLDAGASSRVRRAIPLVPIGLLFAPFLILPLYPPTDWDSIMYHLPIARSYAVHHAVSFLPAVRVSFFPQLSELVDAAVLLYFDDIAVQLTHLLLLALAAVGIATLGRLVASARAGLWAAGLFLASPLVVLAGASAGSDMPTTLFALAGVYALIVWWPEGSPRWAALSGAALGLAAGAKYLGLIPLALVSIFLAVRSLRLHRRSSLAAFALLAMVAAGPWYARTYELTGNPTYPFFSRVWGEGHGPMTAEDIVTYQRELTPSVSDSPGPAARFSRALKKLFLVRMWSSHSTMTPAALLGILCIPFALRRKGGSRLAATLAGGEIVFWAVSFPTPRYLMPTLPLLSVCAGVALDAFASSTDLFRRLFARRFAAVLLFLLLALPGIGYASLQLWKRGRLPASPENRLQYLASKLQGFRALDTLNRTAPGRSVLYALYAENLVYFSDAEWQGDWFGKYRYRRIVALLPSGSAVADELRGMGATHFLVNRDRFFEFHRRPFALSPDPGLRLIFRDESSMLYEVEPAFR